MLIDNINFLRKHARQLRELISQNEEQLKAAPIEVVETRAGLPTLQVTINNRPLFIHSKYDPMNEAERLVEQYEKEMEKYDHIFFYGVGFGYHVESFLKKYPDKKFTLYEPNPAIFYQYMSKRKIENIPTKNMQHLFVEWNQELGSRFLEQFAYGIKDHVLLVILPAYTRAFPTDFEQFSSLFKNKVGQKGMAHAADAVFAKRWTLNSLLNLPTTLKTPNLLIDKKDVFKAKPVLLVSAGPSLTDEYDNLRQIKANGLAYILAVGSANRALVANDILPDAVLTYDPQAHNYRVFMPMLENQIDTVPMIYGTSVGYETLEYYKGPKLHVITSQDTITPYFTKETLQLGEIADDAFSIAIVTLQLLAKMNAGAVILVGQNFAFRDNLFYSKDIKRGTNTAEVQEKDLEKSRLVKDVFGNQVKTNEAFNQMRLAMERAIESCKNIEIINTTKGGAAIGGAPFTPLEEVMKTKLQEKVVVKKWYVNEQQSDIYDEENKQQLLKSMGQFIQAYEQVFKVLNDLHQNIQKKNIKKTETNFTAFDKQFKTFINNQFYVTIIQPIVRIQFEKLQTAISELNKQTNLIEKANQLIQASGIYMQATKQIYNEISPFVDKVLQAEESNQKLYKSDCGVFSYSGEWSKQALKVEEKQPSTTLTYHYANKVGAGIKFKFFGTNIQLLAGTRKDFAEQLEVRLDGEISTITVKSNHNPEFVWKNNEVVYEMDNLTNEMHEVEITLLEDNPFVFNGVVINREDRLYHVDEVTKVEELEIGKRIRCHYKATFNQVGEFSGLGEGTRGFIPPESSAYPDGDFYFIMVDESDEEGKKLIADRNVQHSISWDTLDYHCIPKGKTVVVSNQKFFLRLLDGGNSFIDHTGEKSMINYDLGAWPKDNEWDKHINNDFYFFGISSWCNSSVIVGLHNRFNINGKFDVKITTEESTKLGRILRGNVNITYLLNLNKKLIRTTEGFRPLIILK